MEVIGPDDPDDPEEFYNRGDKGRVDATGCKHSLWH
jgi:hypothetical protein